MSESQIKANPTKSTLDAIEHEADLEAQRQKRKDSAVEIANPANDARKAGIDNGSKAEQDVSEEYSIAEADEMAEGNDGEAADGVAEEVNEQS